MTTHELTKNTAGQSQSQGSHGHITAANDMEHINAKQTLIDGQDTDKPLQSTPLTRLAPGHKPCTFINYIKTLQPTPNAQQMLTDGQDTTTTYKNATDQISFQSLTKI